MPNGKETQREIVIRGGASVIVPIDEDDNIVFVKQYRHPAKEEVLELPAGMFEKGEDPLICAERELEEETSYKSGKTTFILKMYPSIGMCTEILYIYLAENLSQGQFNLDEDEFVTVEKYSLDEAVNKIFSGEIIDSKTIVGIFAYKEMLSKK